MVCERLCQSITKRAPRNRDASHATNKVGMAGGFWTRIVSGLGMRSSVINNPTPWRMPRIADPKTKRLMPPLARPANPRSGRRWT